MHQCGGEAGGGKKGVLCYKERHKSQISSAELVNSTDSNRKQARRCDNMKLHERLKHIQPLLSFFFLLACIRSTLLNGAAALAFQRQYRGNKQHAGLLEAICWPDTAALSQPNDNANTEGKKRCFIVLQRLKV